MSLLSRFFGERTQQMREVLSRPKETSSDVLISKGFPPWVAKMIDSIEGRFPDEEVPMKKAEFHELFEKIGVDAIGIIFSQLLSSVLDNKGVGAIQTAAWHIARSADFIFDKNPVFYEKIKAEIESLFKTQIDYINDQSDLTDAGKADVIARLPGFVLFHMRKTPNDPMTKQEIIDEMDHYSKNHAEKILQ